MANKDLLKMRSEIDPYGEETWEDEVIKKTSFWKMSLMYMTIAILCIGIILLAIRPVMDRFITSIFSKEQKKEQKLLFDTNKYKICYSKYFKKYAVKDVEDSKLFEDNRYYKKYGSYGYLSEEYNGNNEYINFDTFDDSTDAIEYIKDHEKYLIEAIKDDSISKIVIEDKIFK